MSFAGYHQGAELPSAPDGEVFDVTTFGAVADSEQDASDAIELALSGLAAAGGGVLYFPAGEYRLSRPIVVQSDHTLLRGDGPERTRLVFTQPLETSYAPNRSGETSVWSYAGGMIWLAPTARRSPVPDAQPLWDHWREGWLTGETRVPLLDNTLARGSTRVMVAESEALAPGQLVLLELDNAQSLAENLAGSGEFARTVDWSDEAAAWILPPQQPTVMWPVVIAAVEGQQVELAQPLRFEARAEWAPRLRPAAAVITESGVRDLTLVLARDYVYSRSRHHDTMGWNGVFLENAFHCYVDNVHVVDAEVAIGLSASKNVTVRNFVVTASSDDRLVQHHGTTTRVQSNDNLFEDFAIEAQPLHGLNVERYSMGNVWSHGQLTHGTWDLHRALSLENAITELTLYNDGRPGGRADAGPRAGARSAVWNVEVTNGDCTVVGQPDMLPSGAIIGLRGCEPSPAGISACVVEDSGIEGNVPEPSNLHRAQRALRLCFAHR